MVQRSRRRTGSPANGRYSGSCSGISRVPHDDVGPRDLDHAAVVRVDEEHVLAPPGHVEPVVHRGGVEHVVIARDHDDGAREGVELVRGPRQLLVGHPRAVEQVAGDEHGVDVLVAGESHRPFEGDLLATVGAGAEVAVGGVQHGRRPARVECGVHRAAGYGCTRERGNRPGGVSSVPARPRTRRRNRWRVPSSTSTTWRRAPPVLHSAGPTAASIDDVQPLTGGASSLTFTGRVTGGPPGHERIVLKVAPPGLEPVRNRDVARQARLMRALDGAPGVRVPLVFFEDDGAPPEVSPFHAMNLVPGECVEPLLVDRRRRRC